MSAPDATAEPAVPVAPTERIELMDVLRGVALFGVFLMNFTAFAAAGVMSTETAAAVAALGAARSRARASARMARDGQGEHTVRIPVRPRLLPADAAPRGARRRFRAAVSAAHDGAADPRHAASRVRLDLGDPSSICARGLRAARVSQAQQPRADRGGIVCAALGRTAQKALAEFGSAATWTGAPDPYADAAVLERQQLAQSGDYFAIVGNFFDWAMVDYLLSGLILGWLFYSLGRFFIGAWVGRHGWITRAQEFLPGWRRVLRVALPAGLIFEGAAVLLLESPLLPEYEHREFFAQVLHLAAVPVLATGYVAAVVVGFETPARPPPAGAIRGIRPHGAH